MLTRKTRDRCTTLLDAAALQPENDAFPAIIYVETAVETDTLITRRRFRHEVTAYARALAHLGVQPRDLVVIAHTQNLESIFAFWGALLIGAIPSMFPTLTEKLDPAIYMRSMAELVRFSNVRAILTTDAFKPELAAVVDCAVYGSNELHALPVDAPPVDAPTFTPDPDAIAFLQHSSGTTGLQKGVALSHTAVLNQIAAYSDTLNLSQQDTIVSWLPLYHDMGLIAGFMLPLVQGVPLVLMSPFDWVRHPALLFDAIDRYQATLCWLPNFAYNHSARRIRRRDLEDVSLDSMRMFINCSEPVRDDSHALFLERFAAHGATPKMLAVSYAMAENTFAVTQTQPGKPPRRDVVDRLLLEQELRAKPTRPNGAETVTLVSCGRPIPGTAVRAIDDAGQSLPERRVGELAVRSDCMLTEYYQRSDLEPFVDGWFKTGDRGYLANGEVYVVGRSKDLIINAGKNVYPQDIEAIVNEVDGVHAGRAVVFGVPDEREGTELIAVVAEVDTDDDDARKAISKAIRQEVARQTLVTVSFVSLVNDKWLIKTSSGKIARNRNREKWLEEKG